MKEARGKKAEENHLRRFRESFPDFPAGELISAERPDFLVKTSDKVIGIEHTRYMKSDLGAKEGAEDKALWLASRDYENRGFPPTEVHVHWNFHEKLTNRTMSQFVANFSEFVAMHLPESGGEVTIRYPHRAWRQMPIETTSVTISRRRSGKDNFWVSARGGFVSELSSTDLYTIIGRKESKVPSYRRNCMEVWLLIVADGFGPSTHCELAPEVNDTRFQTRYDRLFFFHHFNGLSVELSTSTAG